MARTIFGAVTQRSEAVSAAFAIVVAAIQFTLTLALTLLLPIMLQMR